MAATQGKLFVLVDASGSPEVTIAKARSNSISVNGETVDITSKGSSGYRELLSGAGIRSVSLSVSGVYDDAAYDKTLLDRSMDGATHAFKVIDGNGDYFSGDFIVTSYERGGEYNGEVTFSATLESAGVVAYTEV